MAGKSLYYFSSLRRSARPVYQLCSLRDYRDRLEEIASNGRCQLEGAIIIGGIACVRIRSESDPGIGSVSSTRKSQQNDTNRVDIELLSRNGYENDRKRYREWKINCSVTIAATKRTIRKRRRFSQRSVYDYIARP